MCWNKGRLCWKIAKLFYFCHLKKLVRPETFGPYHVSIYQSVYQSIHLSMYQSIDPSIHSNVNTHTHTHKFGPFLAYLALFLFVYVFPAKIWQKFNTSRLASLEGSVVHIGFVCSRCKYAHSFCSSARWIGKVKVRYPRYRPTWPTVVQEFRLPDC